jgi:methionyl-tRNA formyltransferase
MNLVFMGTPDFSVPALDALVAAGHRVLAVYTQPPRPAGRGQKEQPSPVQRAAERHGLAVRAPKSLRDAAAQAEFKALGADLAVVAAYGLILPKAILDAPLRGCLNIHASLLPRWRGAAPIQRAIEAGDAETGITIMVMDEGLDTGPMLMKRALPIGPADTTGSLHDRLAVLGAEMIVEALRKLPAGELVATPQPADGATYAAKIGKAEAAIDWRRPAAEIERAMRAFNPFPGAVANLRQTPVKVWRAEVAAGRGEPGAVLHAEDGGVVVACGDGALRLVELQKPGSRRMSAGEFLRGFPVIPGERFDFDAPVAGD